MGVGSSTMATVALTEADDGKAVAVRAGDEIVVRLPENPTTGYRWQVERADDALQADADSFELAPHPQVGSGGIRSFRFRVSAGLRQRLAIDHRQAWDESSVIDRFRVDLDVAE